MRDLATLNHHPTVEKISEIICRMTQNFNKPMYRMMVCYHLCRLASTMRVSISTEIRGKIPINAFVITLATSGQYKTYSSNIVEKEIMGPFTKVFTEQTLPVIAEENLAKLAVKRAYLANEDPDVMLQAVTNEYENLGELRFSFCKATPAAIQQMRQKLLMAKAGAVNLEIDEIGINLLPNTDALGVFLELYDIGDIKESLTKSTRDSTRIKEIKGLTPTNLLAYGTPTKLLDGGKTEEALWAFLDMGYARRSLFCYSKKEMELPGITAEEMYDAQADPKLKDGIKALATEFSKLANAANYNRKITLTKKVGVELFEYNILCKKRAFQMPENREMMKTEMEHRYFKALKLAGAFAFIDGHSEITMNNLYAAIRIVEDSGDSFADLVNRERTYEKLARYIASVPQEVTHVDLTEDLAFYKGSAAQKNDLMNQAIAWGHKNHIIIKTAMSDGIEFIKGSTLTETNLQKLTVAHSPGISDGYKNDIAPFDKLHILALKKNYNWINHHTINGHRDSEHMIPGFNTVVLDVDKGTKVAEACALLEKYKFMLYTTKRHTPAAHRFRIVMPLNYEMTMNEDEYRVFMENLFEWLPFDVDTQTNQRSRKWLTHPGQHYYSKGTKLLDARLFIPKTKKNDERKQLMKTYSNLSNLERWFVQNSSDGNRNNQLLRYALLLVDMGYDHMDVRTKVLGLNSGLADRLDESEIDRTIMTTVSKAIGKRTAKAA